MITGRIAPLGAFAIVVATLVHADARQVQRDPPRTSPPAAQTPGRDAPTPSATGTAIVSGVVTSEESTPRPVRRALLTLSSPDATPRTTLTDDDGRFAFTGQPAGRFTLSAAKAGWVTGYFGVRGAGRGPGTTVAVGGGQKVTADLTMTRGAVIAGRIVNQFGQPQADVQPVVMEFRTIASERVLSFVRGGVTPRLSATDDRGEYRIYGLPPGTYVVSAMPAPAMALSATRETTADEIQWARRNTGAVASQAAPPPAQGAAVGLAPVFYPGTSDAAAATPIVLAAGAERTGIDFAMVPVPMAKVDGNLTRSDGQPVQAVQLTIVGREALVNPADTITTRPVISPQGRFSFPVVRPGEYRIIAQSPSRSASPPAAPAAPGAQPVLQPRVFDLYAIVDVTVNGRDIDNLTLALQPGTTITGRIVFEGATLTPPEDPLRTQLVLMPPSSVWSVASAVSTYRTFPQPDRTFSIAGVMPGRYLWTTNVSATATGGGPAWTLKSIVMGGRDIAEEPIDVRPGASLSDVVVTFTDRSAEIAGTIFDGAGRPAPGFVVVVFPVQRNAWVQNVTTLPSALASLN